MLYFVEKLTEQQAVEALRPDVVTLLKRYVSAQLPIVQTTQIGHGTDSQGIMIGQYIK